MSIASAITAAQGKVAAAYTAISNKGGTLPATQNLSNMPTAINSIPTGGSPNIQSLSVTPSTSSQTITATGGVDGYSPINVSAVTSSIDNNITAGNIKKDVTILGVTGTFEGGSTGYTEFPPYQVTNGVLARRSGALTGTEFSDVTEITSYGLYHSFYACNLLTGSLDLSNITTIGQYGLYNAFGGCTNITSVDLSSLTAISASGAMYMAFYGCTSLTSANLSKLQSIGGASSFYNVFNGCTNLTSVNVSKLKTITSAMYRTFSSSGLTEIRFTALDSINVTNAFQGCFGKNNGISIYFPALKTTSFGSYTNQFKTMLSISTMQYTSNATLHFPSNLQNTISGLSGYPNFGGSNTTILFDLPATS